VLIFLVLSAHAQKTKTTISPASTTDSSVVAPMNKDQKTEADANNYERMAGEAKTKIKTLFPSKPGDTVYFVIADISYNDSNLKLLKI
jgi:hypothetical protein